MKYFEYFFSTVLILILILISCNKDYHPLGEPIFSDLTLETKNKNIPVFTYQQSVNQVQSNVQPLAQLGQINHPVFGVVQASIFTQISIGQDLFFGNLKQSLENSGDQDDVNIIPENETIKEVYLEIPFFSNTNDSDNDGVIDLFDADPNDPASNSDNDNLTDIVESQLGLNPLSEDSDEDGILDHDDNDNQNYDSENRVYEIDSIYGNRDSEFNLQVHELTYYLNNLDSNDNFESAQIYYSNRDYYDEGYIGETLFNGQIKLNYGEVRLNFAEDDLASEDIDETTLIETRLSPRLRIPLNKNFFQKNLIELEGTNFLLNDATYQKRMRGIIIRGDNFSDNLYMLLDIQNAEINVNYVFDDYNTQGTLDDLSDDIIEKRERNLTLSLGNIRINSLKNSAFNSAIKNRIEASQNNQPSDKLFVQSSRLHGKIRLFSNENPEGNEILNNIREEKLLVNQANLIFYVDPETITEEITAQRIYLYNFKNGLPISDYIIDLSTSNFGTNSNKSTFGGILELSEDGKPYLYKFNLTNHITNIIKNDSLNYDLGLAITGNIENPLTIKAKTSEEGLDIDYPLSATLNPLGTVLVGSHPDSTSANKKVKLELIYSSY
ncbi:MAG: DUF4270 domain-containing protein [Flavobacteriaceae bacterium]